MTLRLGYALPAEQIDVVADRLRSVLGPVSLRPWFEGAERDGVLLLAPHEFTARQRTEICSARPWSWVHLSSAGADFLDLTGWPSRMLLTRSWRCYAAPLAEYAVHAILTREWCGAAPWELSDHRLAATAGGPPVPESIPANMRGLCGARIGVAGWGEVGRRIGTTVCALGADVVVLRRSDQDETTRDAVVTSDRREMVDVDHLVVALPLNDRTNGLFDGAVLERARPGMHLVNVSRPQIVDQNALLRLCAAGRLAATLDVTDPEPLPPEHPLRSLPSVRLSPHVAWRSRLSGLGYIDDFAALVTMMAAGDRPPAAAWSAGSAESATSALRTWRR